MIICPKCQRPHSEEEFNENRFCRNCGKFLFSSESEFHPKPKLSEETKKKIGKYIVEWYEEYEVNSELETTFLDELDGSSSDGRMEILLLARLFSQYRLKEEAALEIWRKLKSWFMKKGYRYREVFEKSNLAVLDEFKEELSQIGFPEDPQKFIDQMELVIRRLVADNKGVEFERKD